MDRGCTCLVLISRGAACFVLPRDICKLAPLQCWLQRSRMHASTPGGPAVVPPRRSCCLRLNCCRSRAWRCCSRGSPARRGPPRAAAWNGRPTAARPASVAPPLSMRLAARRVDRAVESVHSCETRISVPRYIRMILLCSSRGLSCSETDDEHRCAEQQARPQQLRHGGLLGRGGICACHEFCLTFPRLLC